MQIKHRGAHLEVIGGCPGIKRLFGGRYALVYRCRLTNKSESWFHDYKDRIFGEWGSLSDSPLGSLPITSPDARATYPNQRLVENFLEPGDGQGDPIVVFAYETLTAAWELEDANKPSSTENGLRLLTRSQVAVPAVDYANMAPGVSSKIHASGDFLGNASWLVVLIKADPAEDIHCRLDYGYGEYFHALNTTDADKWEYLQFYIPAPLTEFDLAFDGTSQYSNCKIAAVYITTQGGDDWRDGIIESFDHLSLASTSSGRWDGTLQGSLGNALTITQAQSSAISTDDVLPPYDEDDVGVATITNGGKTLTLSAFDDDSDERRGKIVTRWAEAGILSVRTPKVGGQQTVVVSAIGMTEVSVKDALSEVTTSHELVDQSTSDYEGFQAKNFTFEVDDFDVLSATENGLKRLTRTQLATSAFSRGTVGSDNHPTDATLILSGEEIDNGNTIKKRVSRWAEPGITSKSQRVGPAVLPGTKYITFVSQGVPYYPKIAGGKWTYTSDIEEMADDTKAKLYSEDDNSVLGFQNYTRTYLVSTDTSGTITGVKYTYTDFINVDVPGAIECITTPVSLGDVSGGIADYRITNKDRKEINVTVTVEITEAPPSGTARAFNIDAISASITAKRMSLRNGPGQTVTWGSDTNRRSATGYSQAFSASVALRDLPGYYVKTGKGSATGTVQYIGRSWYEVTNNTIGTEQTSNSHQQTTADATGTTEAQKNAAYTETGLVDIKPRPIFVTLDGTVYWEVIRWTAA